MYRETRCGEMTNDRSDESNTGHKIPFGGNSQWPNNSESSDVSSQLANLAVSNFHDDSPISSPDEDMLNYVAFAKSIARCIVGIKNADGGAIAINGSWGSGKSSVVNLVRHELKSAEDSLTIIPFNSWNYRSEDGIVAGFFQELYLGVRKDSYGASINLRHIKRLGLHVTRIARISSSWINIPGLRTISSVILEFIKFYLQEDQRIESMQEKIGNVLESKGKRILIIIDDIDRLSKEEAIAIFRLIKSVGRLKNVIYLLAYDRTITERMIKEVYRFERKGYLEKIVQAHFSLPKLNASVLADMLNSRLDKIFGNMLSDNSKRTHSIISEVVVPELKTPRDLHRLTNMLSVTYKSVEGYVNVADFIALESMRLFHPHMYQEIQSHKEMLTEDGTSGLSLPDLEKFVEGVILAKEPNSKHSELKKSLMRIFPVLDPKFLEFDYDYTQEWNLDKRVCSKLNFDKYFSFSVLGDIISEEEFEEFIRRCGDRKYVKSMLLEYSKAMFANSGRSKVSFLLEKISNCAYYLEDDDALEVLCTVYSVAEDIQRNCDDAVKIFGHVVNNDDRIIELSEKIIWSRHDFSDLLYAMPTIYDNAPLDLLSRLTIIIEDHIGYKKEQGDIESYLKPNESSMKISGTDETPASVHDTLSMFKRDDMNKLRSTLFSRIEKSISDNSIFLTKNVFDLLRNWKKLADDPHNVVETVAGIFKMPDKSVLDICEKCNHTFFLDFDNSELSSIRYAWAEGIYDDDKLSSKFRDILRTSNLTENDRSVAIQLLELVEGEEIVLAMS